jgi:hypothetical protein
MQRRQLFRLGLGSALILGVAVQIIRGIEPAIISGRLGEGGRQVFGGVARAVLAGSLPTESAAMQATLNNVVKNIDDIVSGLPPTAQRELNQLLGLLNSAPGRVGLAGLAQPWESAETESISAALEGMRTSSLAVRQQAFHALRDLVNAAYYVTPQAWMALGYPGPIDIS